MSYRWLVLTVALGITACAARAPDVGKTGALAAVNQHMAGATTINQAEYTKTVTDAIGEDGKRYYFVEWNISRRDVGGGQRNVAGGLIVFWVDPATGKVVRAVWYQ